MFNLTGLSDTPETSEGVPTSGMRRRHRWNEKLDDHKGDTQFLKTILHSFTIGNGTRAITDGCELFHFFIVKGTIKNGDTAVSGAFF